MRKWLRLLLLLLGVYLALCSLLALVLADVTLHPGRRPLPPTAEQQMHGIVTELLARLDDVAITAADGTLLRAWYVQREHGNRKAVILLHGLGDNRLGTVGYAELFLSQGYDVLMPDARAHGASGGTVATYGVLERNEIRAWYKWLDQRDRPQCIYALGESMGAAQLLQSLAVEPHFCAVVAESSFSSFREIAYDRMG